MLVDILHTVHLNSMSRPGHGAFRSRRFNCLDPRNSSDNLEAASFTKPEKWSSERSLFHASMTELGLLGLLVLVFSITLLPRYAPQPKAL